MCRIFGSAMKRSGVVRAAGAVGVGVIRVVIRKVSFNSLHWQKNVGGGAPLEVPIKQSRAGASAAIRREGIGYRKATCCRQRQPPPALNAFVALPLCLQITYCCNSAAPPSYTFSLPVCISLPPSSFLVHRQHTRSVQASQLTFSHGSPSRLASWLLGPSSLPS